MNTVSEELSRFAKTASLFKSYVTIDKFDEKLDRFLFARMDEIRLSRAGELSLEILKILDLDDFDFLREGVLKRESTGKISYQNQRDHSAHTLYNWILGWYIYENNPVLRRCFETHIHRRGWVGMEYSADIFFGNIWQYASLLHDIGYLFEGSLALIDPSTQSEQVEIGVRIVKDYFESKSWLDFGLSSIHERNLVKRALNVSVPDLNHNLSLAAIADSLRDLGDLKNLSQSLSSSLSGKPVSPSQYVSFALEGLPGDSFDLWEAHYRQFGSDLMAKRILGLRTTFESLVHRGMPSLRLRIADHGVCSGLLLLLAATYYYKLRYAIDHTDDPGGAASRVLHNFKTRVCDYPYNPVFWWSGIVWASAATALHNLQQSPELWDRGSYHGPLGYEEDPLAYLGILVDILQEWDRYSVFPVPGKLPLQNTDVTLGVEADKVVITLPSKNAMKVRKELDNALLKWEDIVLLKSSP